MSEETGFYEWQTREQTAKGKSTSTRRTQILLYGAILAVVAVAVVVLILVL